VTRHFSYAIGTQTFRPTYSFSGESRLVETARAILEMGSHVIKLGIHKTRQNNREVLDFYNLPQPERYQSLTQVLRYEPSYRAVLEMPFEDYLIWVYPFSTTGIGTDSYWHKGITDEQCEYEYQEMFDLTRYLLTAYSGTDKVFYLGHWEGDWSLLGHTNPAHSPEPAHSQGMIEWLNVRQKAVDDARQATPHHDVSVFNYAEVNRVSKEMREGRPCMTNAVLPHVNVDYVSYSSYDSCYDPETNASLAPIQLRDTLYESLDQIERHLQPKPEIRGKRVFIGEYGFPLDVVKTPQAQAACSIAVMRAALDWGCPFILYWQMYDNEAKEGGVDARGFWLIDNKGVKQPVYTVHQQFLTRARQYVQAYQEANGYLPSREEYARVAVDWLQMPLPVSPNDEGMP
jgi:hypothetical protein